MKTKLKWKKMQYKDNIDNWEWVEASIKPINWVYIVDIGPKEKYVPYMMVNGECQENRLSKKEFKSLEQAKEFCEKHLLSIAQKLQKYLL